MSGTASTADAGPVKRVLLTGATGYVGGRLAPRLLQAGYQVRCVVRCRRKLSARPWAGDQRVEIVEADLGDTEQVTAAMADCQAAYYLVHSMQAVGHAYAEHDRQLAATFAVSAQAAGLGRIIYLGGLGELGDGLSAHLSSRREVERVLADGPVPVTVLRAAIILGSGSASFEILRYLVERLPVMVTPKWVNTACQPIATSNVLHYLVACLEVPETIGATLDIGGAEVLDYRQIMQTMAAALHLPRRLIIPIPLLTPRLSSLWLHLVTPISYRLARPLAEGLRNRVVCRDDRAAQLMPQQLLTVRQAIDVALGRTAADEVKTAWSDAGVMPGDPDWAGGTVLADRRQIDVAAGAEAVFDAVCHLGGTHGYHAADILWELRGLMDRLVGGPGLQRGRRHRRQLAYGDALDFWRVVDVDRPRRLRLEAEMKLPGKAQLEFKVEPRLDSAGAAATRLYQQATFKPQGLAGLAYWCAVAPLHGIVFKAMISGIRLEAEVAQGRRRRPAALAWGVVLGPDGARPPARRHSYHLAGAHP